MWMIWAIALLFGLLAAPWYAPAAISLVFAVGWFAIAGAGHALTGEAVMRLAVVIAVIALCWAAGRGARRLYDRARQLKPN